MANRKIAAALDKILKRVAKELQATLGDGLLSLVLANASNLANYVPNRSEVQLLLVLKQCKAQELKLVAPIIHAARRELVLDVQILAEHDLHSSTDVFPLKLLQIQQSYQLLCGHDFFGNLLVEPDHLRLACEREVKTLLMRLRHLFLMQSGHRLSLRDTLADSVQGVFQLIRCALQLSGFGAPDAEEDLLEKAENSLGVNPAALIRVFMLKFETQKVDPTAMDKIFADYLESVEAIATFFDRLSTQ